MGEGDLGILYALLVLSPYIAVGLFCLIGAFLLFRKGRGSKIVGGGMLVLAVFGIFGIPVLNSLLLDIETDEFLSDAVLPEALTMQDASVLVVGSQSPDCALVCAEMIEGGHVSKIAEVRVGQGPAEEIYRAGPFDLTSLSGYVQDANGRPLVTKQVTDDVEFVLFNETHWLAYHDAQSFLQFPKQAYSGVFLFRVADPHAFDISQAELVLRIYQSEQKPGRFLWFSETTNDQSLPSDAQIAQMFEDALSEGASPSTVDQ
ncbi:hypothetical protein [Ruegeria sp. A3M17]|uniref:hypothetical protein n=1 Tax=Ruegeria sp. A3M17 TaxID=2267229 RepID=UPI000DE8B3E0|nr:hypothetical protein [Ruegeria sp. A3M17]RBW61209.1 hypothetical protein DS906_05385 [Ruegeria sp. A3M17]